MFSLLLCFSRFCFYLHTVVLSRKFSRREYFCESLTPFVLNLSNELLRDDYYSKFQENSLVKLQFCKVRFLTYSSRYDAMSNLARRYFRKAFLKNMAKFTGKHLCQSLPFNKVVGLQLF